MLHPSHHYSSINICITNITPTSIALTSHMNIPPTNVQDPSTNNSPTNILPNPSHNHPSHQL